MQNQIVNNAIKGLWQTIPGNIGKSLTGLTQQRAYLNGSQLLSNPSSNEHLPARNFCMGRSASVLLPGGGLGKFQGRFLEEMYFNANDNKLLAQIPQSGYQLTQKCKDGVPDWSEFERMANACSNTILLRQTAMLNKHKNGSEESFFLQEQKSLLERILEILKNLTFNRRMPPPYNPFGPYGHGSPPYGSPYGPYYHQTAQNQRSDEAIEKQDENEAEKEAENDAEKETENANEMETDKADSETGEMQNDDDVEEKSDFGNTDWQPEQDFSHNNDYRDESDEK